MTRLIYALVAGCVALAVSDARAGLVAYWNFNAFDPAEETVLAADLGSGEISLAGWDGGVAAYAGSTTNALGGDPAGDSLSLVGDTGNGTFIDLSFSMAGMRDLEISYWTRSTGTGYDANQWSYSLDGANFTDFGPEIEPSTNTSGALAPPLGLTGLDEADTAYLRYTLEGASSGAGNNRIDNLQLNASAVPEPSSFALLGAAGLGLLFVRRHLRRPGG